jgi:hypothetical protein
MNKFLENTSDRRQTPRTKLVEIAYIGMGPENGGLVLDVSDGGLSFHAVAPVQTAETVHFLLSLRGHSRIEGAGQVVWTNEMKTVCGLKFTSLSSGAREHLNNWTNQSRTPVAASGVALSPAPAAIPKTEEAPPPLAIQSEATVEPLFAIPPVAEVPVSTPEASISKREVRMPWQEPLFFWFIFGVLFAAMTLAAFIYGVHIGESRFSSARQTTENPAPQTPPPSPAPGPVTASPGISEAPSVPNVATPAPSGTASGPTGAASAPTGTTSVPSVAAPAPTGAPASASKTVDKPATPVQRPGPQALGAIPSRQHSADALASGKSELAAALANLNGDNGKRDPAKAVQQLWAAVANGNPEAELLLSDLYASGDGVAKNCQQARVLLIAATKSGNEQAKVKLDELNASGCP